MKDRTLLRLNPPSADWKPLASNPDCFRIALFGRRAAGKTCFLTAFSLPRTPHPAKLTCSLNPYLPNDAPPYRLGWERIQRAANQIREGSAPEPTRNSELLAFRLTLGSPETGNYKVEMFDYSGELLDSETADTELATRLLAKLQASDAVVVLAEYAPELPPLAEDLTRLGQAFNALKDKCPEIPVAFLVNKWDRNLAMTDGERTIESQSAALKSFLEGEPAPPHRRLRDQIQNATGQRFREFPVSAFGRTRNETVETESGRTALVETPILLGGQLESFGLEDALFWLIAQAEAAALERVRKAEVDSRSIFVRPLKKRVAAFRDAKNELRRFAARGTAASALRELERNLKRSVIRRMAFAGVGLGLFAVVVLLSSDEYRYRRQVAMIESPNSEVGEVAEAEERLERFRMPGYRYGVMHRYRPPSEIAKLIEASWVRRDLMAWEIVEATAPLATKAEEAEAYLAQFPTGRNRPEAAAVIGEWRQIEDGERVKAFLARLDAELNRFRKLPAEVYPQAIKEIELLEREIDDQKPTSVSGAETSAGLNTRRLELSNLKIEFEIEVNHGSLKKEFKNLIESGRGISAGQFLVELPPDQRAQFKNEIGVYKGHIVGMVGHEIAELSRGGREWGNASNQLKIFTDRVVKADLSMHPEDIMEHLNGLSERIEREGDRYLYEIAQKLSNKGDLLKALDLYLSEAPLGVMRNFCEDRRRYLGEIEKSHRVDLVLETIKWGDKVDKVAGNYVTVSVFPGTPERKGPYESIPGLTTRPSANNKWRIGHRTFTDTISIEVSAEDDGTGAFNKEDSLGKKSLAGRTLSSLSSGIAIVLEDAKIAGTELHFRVDGFPIEPPLPPYGSQ